MKDQLDIIKPYIEELKTSYDVVSRSYFTLLCLCRDHGKAMVETLLDKYYGKVRT